MVIIEKQQTVRGVRFRASWWTLSGQRRSVLRVTRAAAMRAARDQQAGETRS